MSEAQQDSKNRHSYYSEAFKSFICTNWAPYDPNLPTPLPAAQYAAQRRRKLAELFPGERLVIPAGGAKVRNNDCDFPFRPNSEFAYFSGLGSDQEPNAVLVVAPDGAATLYFHPRVPRTDAEFYSSARYGEMWVGQRASLDEMSALCGIPTAQIEDLPAVLSATALPTRVLRVADPDINEIVDAARGGAQLDRDDEFAVAASELRLIKDSFEIDQLRAACNATARAFAAMATELPGAVARGRGERWLEGTFYRAARHAGNDVGYGSIVAAGDHANTLHWVRNTGDIRDGELVLIDAGIELDTLYTADVTRTLPINGRFTTAQRQVYDTVLAAQSAGMAAAKNGAKYSDVHTAAITVIAQALAEWGILPVSADEALSEEGQQYRRWMVHGTSHHLGLDVHDCACARREMYKDGYLATGMVVTVEPGIYFKSTDLLVPPELRGIGVRIEDDVLITETGCENLSDGLPRTADGIEAWIAPLLEAGRAQLANS